MSKRRSNWIYVLFQSFTSDLLFWIVLDNLFLTTVKGFSAFEVVLITMLGIAFSLVFYPLANLIIKKTNNETSIIIGAGCFVMAIILFMCCSTIYGFVIGQTFYQLSAPFRMVASVMLKNNLKEENKEDQFVKWQSYGKLGYASITLFISLIAGYVFNTHAYLPMALSLFFALVGLVFAIIYTDDKTPQEESKTSVKVTSLLKNKTMILIMLMNLIAVGTYIFLQGRATLLIQYVCEDANLDLAKISLIVSGMVFGSRLVRVLSNLLFPKIYSCVKNKSRIIIAVSLLLLMSNICFAVGGNINAPYVVKLIIIALGFYLILSFRDAYVVMENKIITTSLNEDEQKQAFVLATIYDKFGRLLSNISALIILGFMPLRVVYIFMLLFSVAQIFVGIPLSKHVKNDDN